MASLAGNNVNSLRMLVQAADDAANGLAGALLTAAPVGAKLTSAALFIDVASSEARL